MSEKYHPDIAGSQFLPENRESSYSTFLKDQLAAERAKAAGLLETIESQKQTHDALVKKVAGLEAQNAVMRAALEFYKRNWVANADGDMCEPHLTRTWYEPNDALFHDAGSIAQQALSLTPSDAAEMMRKKDEAVKGLVKALSFYAEEHNYEETIVRRWPNRDVSKVHVDCGYTAFKAIEAARAAGMDVV